MGDASSRLVYRCESTGATRDILRELGLLILRTHGKPAVHDGENNNGSRGDRYSILYRPIFVFWLELPELCY